VAFFVRRRRLAELPGWSIELDVAEDLEQDIREDAQGPARAQGDSGSVQQHALKDQVEADRYLASKQAAKKPKRGLQFSKLVPPGSV
jgi:hypothetical protein